MSEKNVSIKYDSSGIFIHFKEAEFDVLYNELKDTLENADGFFKGSSFRGIEGIDLDLFQKGEIDKLLNLHGIRVNEKFEDREQKIKEAVKDMYRGLPLGPSKLFMQTIRSGQMLQYEGSIIFIGDLNSGGEIKAGGNIIIFGTARGRVQAGINGNKEAFVMGYQFENAQILIDDIIYEEALNYKERHMLKLQIENNSIIKKII
jgi:septum site-determining protein MinC